MFFGGVGGAVMWGGMPKLQGSTGDEVNSFELCLQQKQCRDREKRKNRRVSTVRTTATTCVQLDGLFPREAVFCAKQQQNAYSLK